MRYFSRLKCFKNATGTNKYYPETVEAYSYDHWKYLTMHSGKMIFNNTSYSNTTSKHQSNVYSKLNYNVDIVLNNTTESLHNPIKALTSEVVALLAQNKELLDKINSPRTQKKANANRAETINSNGKQVQFLIETFSLDYDLKGHIVFFTELDRILGGVAKKVA